MKSKAEIVIKALQQGHQIDLGFRYHVALGQTKNEDTVLCFVYTEGCNPVCDINVGAFIDLCDKLSDEQVRLIAANNALSAITSLDYLVT